MVRATEIPLADILPLTAGVTDAGHLTLGGCDAVELAGVFGTPLYVFDEETLRGQCRAFQEAFQSRYHNSIVAYAAKAYLGRALASIIAQEGMSLDVVSGGELAVAASVGFPAERIHFHGNNKSEQELREALDYGIARIVVDNFHELQLLNGIAQGRGVRQKILSIPIAKAWPRSRSRLVALPHCSTSSRISRVWVSALCQSIGMRLISR